MGNAHSVSYGSHLLTMNLHPRGGKTVMSSEKFGAVAGNYRTQLMARRDLPAQLRRLLLALFHRGAITECRITFGNRVELWLPRTSPKTGRMLLSGKALKEFTDAFTVITGQNLTATSEAESGRTRSGRGRNGDIGGVLGAIVNVVEGVCDGISLAAAIETLTDGS